MHSYIFTQYFHQGGLTPLRVASAKGNIEAVQVLLTEGANVHAAEIGRAHV